MKHFRKLLQPKIKLLYFAIAFIAIMVLLWMSGPTSEQTPSQQIAELSKPIYLSEEDAKNMITAKGYYDASLNPDGKGIQHEYKLQYNGKIVFDAVTGLYWQQEGSPSYMTFNDAQTYIQKLNNDKYCGYNNWRLPTLEEAMSLMEPTGEYKGKLYIDPVFNEAVDWIWTADKDSTGYMWTVMFDYGDCFSGWRANLYLYWIRAVR